MEEANYVFIERRVHTAWNGNDWMGLTVDGVFIVDALVPLFFAFVSGLFRGKMKRNNNELS